MVDWVRLCREHGIGFDERGTSVKRNNINIECPFCRDGKRLMGLELDSNKWACWKDERHRGRNAAYLVSVLLKISQDEARELLGLRPPPSAVADLEAALAALGAAEPAQASEAFPLIELPPVFFKLRPNGKRSRRFLDYLAGRNLGAGAIERYQLSGSDHDWGFGRDRKPLKSRVAVPLTVDGQTIGYTARSIDGHPRRYHTEPAGATAQSVWFENLATGGQVLVITEGQFDAMLLDWVAFRARLPVHAIALGGLARTRGKTAMLDRIMRRYRKSVLLLDAGAFHRAIWMQKELARPVELGRLPEGVSDPGDLAPRQARLLLEKMMTSSLCA